ncbi:hypothetical protein [Pseudomonas asiatica]|uniref:hypothetical protein n=1 Tax=Pseudomonas asiatica TaxID=2219225 RepID=UPI0025AAD424|nr:hypothetical protein [Pseudomonas asiatica]MDM9589491.1 hypothetical protein [Pseudomonas asiatica]
MHLTDEKLIEKYHGFNSLSVPAIELFGIPCKIKVGQKIEMKDSLILKFKLSQGGQTFYTMCQDGETVGRLKVPRSSYPLLLRAVWNAAQASPNNFASR